MPLFLTQDQVNFYKENGYVKFRVFNDKEMDRIEKEYEDLFRRKQNPGMESAWIGEDMVKQAKTTEYSVSILLAFSRERYMSGGHMSAMFVQRMVKSR